MRHAPAEGRAQDTTFAHTLSVASLGDLRLGGLDLRFLQLDGAARLRDRRFVALFRATPCIDRRWAGMSWAMIFGLVLSTILTLLVIPTAYVLFAERFKMKVA